MKRSGGASSMTIGGGVSGNGVGDPAATSSSSGSFSMDGQVRELKLGSTFNSRNTSTAFHTIKYDFKPASVDFNKVATFNIEPNNQVTVTVPNVESSGVPNTVYKGVQRKYTKECLLIIDRDTGVVTLEKLNDNIMMKKTRAAGPPGPAPGPLPTLENSTKRISSKTKVSTGNRKTNSNIISAPSGPRSSNTGHGSSVTQGMSPLQSTFGISGNTRSPIQAPEWKANAAPSTLPSVPMLLDDDDDALMTFPPQNVFANNQRQSQSPGGSSGGATASVSGNHRHKNQKKQQSQSQLQPQMQLQQPQNHHHQQQSTFSNNFNIHSNNSSIFGGGSGTGSGSGSRDYSHIPVNGSNGSGGLGGVSIGGSGIVGGEGSNLNEDIGFLSSSSSSGSDSESSSDSDSSDSESDGGEQEATNNKQQPLQHQQQQQQHQQQSMAPMPMHSMPPLVSGFSSSNGGELLQNDLQLSESDESDDSD